MGFCITKICQNYDFWIWSRQNTLIALLARIGNIKHVYTICLNSDCWIIDHSLNIDSTIFAFLERIENIVSSICLRLDSWSNIPSLDIDCWIIDHSLNIDSTIFAFLERIENIVSSICLRLDSWSNIPSLDIDRAQLLPLFARLDFIYYICLDSVCWSTDPSLDVNIPRLLWNNLCLLK